MDRTEMDRLTNGISEAKERFAMAKGDMGRLEALRCISMYAMLLNQCVLSEAMRIVEMGA